MVKREQRKLVVKFKAAFKFRKVEGEKTIFKTKREVLIRSRDDLLISKIHSIRVRGLWRGIKKTSFSRLRHSKLIFFFFLLLIFPRHFSLSYSFFFFFLFVFNINFNVNNFSKSRLNVRFIRWMIFREEDRRLSVIFDRSRRRGSSNFCPFHDPRGTKFAINNRT